MEILRIIFNGETYVLDAEMKIHPVSGENKPFLELSRDGEVVFSGFSEDFDFSVPLKKVWGKMKAVLLG